MSVKVEAYSSYLAVQILKTLKATMDYQTLSKHTGIPVSTLTRYVTSKTLPRGKRTYELIEKLIKLVDLNTFIQQKTITDSDYVDVSDVVSESSLVELIVAHMLRDFAGNKIDEVLALDRAGLVLATAFGLSTMKKISYVLNTESFTTNQWLEIKYRNRELRQISRVYVPKNVLRRHVLITAGVLDYHLPLKELRSALSEHKGEMVGVVSIAASKEFLQSIKPYQFGKTVNFIVY